MHVEKIEKEGKIQQKPRLQGNNYRGSLEMYRKKQRTNSFPTKNEFA